MHKLYINVCVTVNPGKEIYLFTHLFHICYEIFIANSYLSYLRRVIINPWILYRDASLLQDDGIPLQFWLCPASPLSSLCATSRPLILQDSQEVPVFWHLCRRIRYVVVFFYSHHWNVTKPGDYVCTHIIFNVSILYYCKVMYFWYLSLLKIYFFI